MAGGVRAGRVRLARLEAVADQAEADAGRWLTAEEASRLQAMSAPVRRRSFLAGHWLAREVAADWLQADEQIIKPLVKSTAAKYAAEKKLTARTPADCQS